MARRRRVDRSLKTAPASCSERVRRRFVLEAEDAMRARGAQPIAEVVGFGASSDAHNLTQPAVDGQVRAMRAALADAGLEPEAIGYINAHATATPAGDKIEIDAIKQTFGDHARRLAVSAHEVDARTSGRRGRGARVRDYRAGACQRQRCRLRRI